jgi:hypothetical protein
MNLMAPQAGVQDMSYVQHKQDVLTNVPPEVLALEKQLESQQSHPIQPQPVMDPMANYASMVGLN